MVITTNALNLFRPRRVVNKIFPFFEDTQGEMIVTASSCTYMYLRAPNARKVLGAREQWCNNPDAICAVTRQPVDVVVMRIVSKLAS